MNVISSADNRWYKRAKSLKVRKYREREGLFIAEGPNLTEEACSQATAEAVFVREGYGGEMPTRQDGVKTLFVCESLFRQLTDTENSRGILAVVRKPRYDACEILNLSGSVLVLDCLQDPGNIGTIIRTAEAAGFAAVLAVKGTADPFSPKAVRAAAGSALRMPICFGGGSKETVEALKDAGRTIVLSHLDGEERDKLPRENMALVIGNEGNGPSREFVDSAHITVRIPMKGKVESLNAAVAAAILMYKQ